MTPEMWLDLEPIPHRASCNSPQIAKFPRGFSTVLPCSLLGSTSHVLHVDVGATPLPVDLVPQLGRLGHQILSCSAVSQGHRVLDRLGLPGSDESDLSASTR